MMAILVVGLSSIIGAMSWLFDWLRIAGAVYLVYLGWKLLRSPEALPMQAQRLCRAADSSCRASSC